MRPSRLNSLVVAAAAACLFATSADIAFAKRSAPEPVKAVTVRGITYSAPPDAMGFVVATNASSGRELWRQRIYDIPFNPARERDVQDVFITSLTIRDDKLLVANERGALFLLDLETHKVTRATHRNT